MNRDYLFSESRYGFQATTTKTTTNTTTNTTTAPLSYHHLSMLETVNVLIAQHVREQAEMCGGGGGQRRKAVPEERVAHTSTKRKITTTTSRKRKCNVPSETPKKIISDAATRQGR